MLNLPSLSAPALPEELWLDIFGRLSYFDLKAVLRVCRTVRKLITTTPALRARLFGLPPADDDVVAAQLAASRAVEVHPALQRPTLAWREHSRIDDRLWVWSETDNAWAALG